MFAIKSIKTKLLGLVIGIGIILSFLLAFVAPWKAHDLAGAIHESDASAIARLLVENLSLGMQMVDLDDGATVKQTLAGLKKDGHQVGVISDVWVYDREGDLVGSLNSEHPPYADYASAQLSMTVLEKVLRVNSPLKDESGELLGYVNLNLSRESIIVETGNFRSLALILALIVMTISTGCALILARQIGRPIGEITTVAKQVAQGDVGCHLEIKGSDEIGALGTSFVSLIDYLKELATAAKEVSENNLTIKVNPRSEQDELGKAFRKMVLNLTGILKQLDVNSEELVGAAGKISSSSESLTSGAKAQSLQVSHVSSAVEEMTAQIVSTTEGAGSASQASRNAAETAAQGGKLVNDTIDGMERIASVVESSSQLISRLDKSAGQIGEIVNVINEIADQTNLLALNAAIEAARAGEQGRGFAVVADEVRKLADRTGKATGEIAATIKGIQTDTAKAVDSMSSGIEEVKNGRELANQAGESLSRIVTMSQEVMGMIETIASGMAEQSSAVESIARNIDEISTVSRQAGESAESSSHAAGELFRQAEGLRDVFSRFKIS